MNNAFGSFCELILEDRRRFLLDSFPLVRRRGRRRTLAIGHLDASFGPLAIAIWSFHFRELKRWGEELSRSTARIEVWSKRTYEDWEGESFAEHRYVELVEIICKWWRGHILFPFKRHHERSASKLADLLRAMYLQTDSGFLMEDGAKAGADELLRLVWRVVSTCGLLPRAGNKILHLGVGEGRLGACVQQLRDLEGFQIVDHCLVGAEFFPQNGDRWKDIAKELTQNLRAPCRAYIYHKKAYLYDPYCDGGRWATIPESPVRGEAAWRRAPRGRFSRILISEVFHHVRGTELCDFMTFLNRVAARRAWVIVQDVLCLTKSIESDFCLYRIDEIAEVFRIAGWQPVWAAGWSEIAGNPYGILLAHRDENSRPPRDMPPQVDAVVERVRSRLCRRIERALKARELRRLHTNEMFEHAFGVLSLANLERNLRFAGGRGAQEVKR